MLQVNIILNFKRHQSKRLSCSYDGDNAKYIWVLGLLKFKSLYCVVVAFVVVLGCLLFHYCFESLIFHSYFFPSRSEGACTPQ